jgi:ATP-dependent RNA helicase DeaD
LIRLHQSRLPAVEEVTDPGYRAEPRPSRDARPPRDKSEPRGARPSPAGEGGTWFRLDVGRANNADPRRLLPMLCRRGDIERHDIGAIRIFDRETKVEIHPARAEHFAEAVRRTAGVGAVGIERLGGYVPGRPHPATARQGRKKRAG